MVSYDNSMTANGQGNFDRYIIGDGRTAATALELKYLDDSTRPYIVEEVNKAVADIQPIEITGDVTNAPDEEDLTSENQGGTDVLKFKDKAYNSALYSGLGRVYLRKNIVTLEGTGKNVLTQAMVNTANTIYHIQYDYDLNGQTITLPAGCVLEFDGGSIKNGTLVGNSTAIKAELVKIFWTNVTINGSWNIAQAYPEWFGAKGDGVTDDSAAMNKVFQFDNVELKNNYLTSGTISINNDVSVKSVVKSKVQYNKFEVNGKATFNGITFDGNMSCSGVFLYYNGITFDSCNFLNTKSNGTNTLITSAIFVGDYYTEEAGTVISDITISNCIFDTAEPRDTSFVSSNSTVARFILAYNPYNLKIINNTFRGLNGIYDSDCIQIRTQTLPSSEYPFAGGSETWSGTSPYYHNTRYMETNTLIDGNYFNMQNTKSAVKIMGSSVIVSNNTVDVSSTETQEDIFAVFRSTAVQNVSYVNNQINLKDIKWIENVFHTATSKNVVMSGNTVVTTGVVETLNGVISAVATTNTTISNNVFVIRANKLRILSIQCVGDVKIDNNAFSLYDTSTETEQMIELFDTRNFTIYPDDNNGGTLCIESNTFICNKKLSLSSRYLNKLALLGNTFKVDNNAMIEATMYMVANTSAAFVYQRNKSDSFVKFGVNVNTTYNQSNVSCRITDANITHFYCTEGITTADIGSSNFDSPYSNHYIALNGNALTVEKCTFNGTTVNFRSNGGTNTVTLMGNTFSTYPRTYVKSGTLELTFKQSDNAVEGVDFGSNLPSNVTDKFLAGHSYYLTGKTKRPTWYDGTKWLDANGYSPVANKGATSARPTLTSDDAGFTYWDTTLGKMIAWNGSAWVNLDGTALA